jgi:hypothetical protein
MKVKMRTTAAGPNGTAQEGQVVDVDAKHAKQLIAGGYAALYETAVKKPRRKAVRKAAETAEAGPPETTAEPDAAPEE